MENKKIKILTKNIRLRLDSVNWIKVDEYEAITLGEIIDFFTSVNSEVKALERYLNKIEEVNNE